MNNGADDNGDFKDMKDWGLAPAGYGHEATEKDNDESGQHESNQ
jgi:hypothetical protein